MTPASKLLKNPNLTTWWFSGLFYAWIIQNWKRRKNYFLLRLIYTNLITDEMFFFYRLFLRQWLHLHQRDGCGRVWVLHSAQSLWNTRRIRSQQKTRRQYQEHRSNGNNKNARDVMLKLTRFTGEKYAWRHLKINNPTINKKLKRVLNKRP